MLKNVLISGAGRQIDWLRLCCTFPHSHCISKNQSPSCRYHDSSLIRPLTPSTRLCVLLSLTVSLADCHQNSREFHITLLLQLLILCCACLLALRWQQPALTTRTSCTTRR